MCVFVWVLGKELSILQNGVMIVVELWVPNLYSYEILHSPAGYQSCCRRIHYALTLYTSLLIHRVCVATVCVV